MPARGESGYIQPTVAVVLLTLFYTIATGLLAFPFFPEGYIGRVNNMYRFISEVFTQPIQTFITDTIMADDLNSSDDLLADPADDIIVLQKWSGRFSNNFLIEEMEIFSLLGLFRNRKPKIAFNIEVIDIFHFVIWGIKEFVLTKTQRWRYNNNFRIFPVSFATDNGITIPQRIVSFSQPFLTVNKNQAIQPMIIAEKMKSISDTSDSACNGQVSRFIMTLKFFREFSNVSVGEISNNMRCDYHSESLIVMLENGSVTPNPELIQEYITALQNVLQLKSDLLFVIQKCSEDKDFINLIDQYKEKNGGFVITYKILNRIMAIKNEEK